MLKIVAIVALITITHAVSGWAQEQNANNLPFTTPGDRLSGSNYSSFATVANLGGFVLDDKYKLRPGDKLSFQIREDKEAPKSLLIGDSGSLDVPYVGRMNATGKTCKQLTDEVKEILEKTYYHRATVTIALDTANKLLGRVYVVGQVRVQGALEIAVNEDLTLAKAILRAGGLGDFANKKKVKVVRPNKGAGQTNQVYIVNVAEILEDGKVEKDMALEPEDLVIVPTRLVNF